MLIEKVNWFIIFKNFLYQRRHWRDSKSSFWQSFSLDDPLIAVSIEIDRHYNEYIYIIHYYVVLFYCYYFGSDLIRSRRIFFLDFVLLPKGKQNLKCTKKLHFNQVC